jgi:hypothetical protein
MLGYSVNKFTGSPHLGLAATSGACPAAARHQDYGRRFPACAQRDPIQASMKAATAVAHVGEHVALDHRLGQFLHEEPHPVGAVDDLLGDLRGQGLLPPVTPATISAR